MDESNLDIFNADNPPTNVWKRRLSIRRTKSTSKLTSDSTLTSSPEPALPAQRSEKIDEKRHGPQQAAAEEDNKPKRRMSLKRTKSTAKLAPSDSHTSSPEPKPTAQRTDSIMKKPEPQEIQAEEGSKWRRRLSFRRTKPIAKPPPPTPAPNPKAPAPSAGPNPPPQRSKDPNTDQSTTSAASQNATGEPMPNKFKYTPRHAERDALLNYSTSHTSSLLKEAKSTGVQSQAMDFRNFYFGGSGAAQKAKFDAMARIEAERTLYQHPSIQDAGVESSISAEVSVAGKSSRLAQPVERARMVESMVGAAPSAPENGVLKPPIPDRSIGRTVSATASSSRIPRPNGSVNAGGVALGQASDVQYLEHERQVPLNAAERRKSSKNNFSRPRSKSRPPPKFGVTAEQCVALASTSPSPTFAFPWQENGTETTSAEGAFVFETEAGPVQARGQGETPGFSFGFSGGEEEVLARLQHDAGVPMVVEGADVEMADPSIADSEGSCYSQELSQNEVAQDVDMTAQDQEMDDCEMESFNMPGAW